MSSSDIAISVRAVSKAYTIRHQRADAATTLAEAITRRLRNPFRWQSESEQFWALKDVSFDVKRGEVVGIIGRNGAGKSTLLKILSRITEMTTGEVDLYGRVGSLLEVGTGFHQELTGRENIFLNGAILGMTRAEIKSQFDAIVDFAGVEKFLDTPVKRYSSGMYVRLAFAVAAHLRSEILIVDEVLAVGDAEFQNKCLGKMKEVSTDGRTVLFVSHNLQSISLLCSHALFLEAGQLNFFGNTTETIDRYTTRPSTTGVANHQERRRGTGEYRFTRAAPVNAVFAPDAEKTIAWEVERQTSHMSSMFIQAMIVDELGQTCAQLDSRLVDVRFEDAPHFSGQFRFRTPWLKPGDYRVDLWLCGGAIIDAFEGACAFTVSPVLPYPQSAPSDSTERSAVLSDFSWEALHDPAVLDRTSSNAASRSMAVPELETATARIGNDAPLDRVSRLRWSRLGTTAMQFTRIAARRAMTRAGGPTIGYVGGAPGNLGDDVMFSAAKRLLTDCRLERLVHVNHERRLANFGLGGRRYFDAILLGGGTLINAAWLPLVEQALEAQLPVWSVGSGVGAWGLGQSDQQDLSAWRQLLPHFKKVGVRGPLSSRKLAMLGFRDAEVVGDAALSWPVDHPRKRNPSAKVFAVNMIEIETPEGKSRLADVSNDWIAELEPAIRERIDSGWTPVGVAMHPADIAPTERLLRRSGLARPNIICPKSFDDFRNAINDCSFGIGMRLHMAVLGACLELPVLSLAYCDKFTDFAESLGTTSLKLRIDRPERPKVSEMLDGLLMPNPELRESINSNIERFRGRLHALLGELQASVVTQKAYA